MKGLVGSLVLTLALRALALEPPKIESQAVEILRRVAEVERGAKSAHFEVASVTENSLGNRHTSTAVYTFIAPDRMRVGDSLFVDGRETWRYRPLTEQYRYFNRRPAIPLDVTAAFPASFAGKVPSLARARLLREETIEIAGQKVDCLVVEAEEVATDDARTGILTTYWIEKRRHLLRRYRFSVEMVAPGMGEGSGGAVPTRVETTYRIATVNEPVSETLFIFTSPKGAEEVEDGKPPFSKPRDLRGAVAADFTLSNLEGAAVQSKNLRGGTVLLHFWASWCKPCQEQMPQIEKLHQRFGKKGVTVLGVSLDRSPEAAQSFWKKGSFTSASVVDADRKLPALYAIDSIPAVVLVDSNGMIAAHWVAAQSPKEYVRALKSLGIQ